MRTVNSYCNAQPHCDWWHINHEQNEHVDQHYHIWLLHAGQRGYALNWALLTCAEWWGYPVGATKWEQRLTQNRCGEGGSTLFSFSGFWHNGFQSTKTLSGSFHVFLVKHGVSCNLFTDWLVKSENFFGVRGSQCRCDFREKRGSPRVDRLVFICFTWPWGVGPPSWRQTHVLGHSSFWAACASGFKGRHQAIPYADGGIMVY